jgi:hypothetical protein
MPAIQASRRLVKSPPELWAEVSDAASLARHLGEVGEIRITRLEPETTVAWEGETASGTVALAPAGWGTSVTLTAEPIAGAEPEPTSEVAPEPEPAAAAEPEPAAATEPEPAEPVAPEPDPAATAEPNAEPEAIVIEEQAEPEPTAAGQPGPRRSWLARLFRRRIEPTTMTEPEPSTTDADRAAAPANDDRAGGAGETISAAPPAESSSPATGPARSSAEPEAEPTQAEESRQDPLEAVLTQALDSLGQAHHRPFSRG